jgi:hypothetical protein
MLLDCGEEGTTFLRNIRKYPMARRFVPEDLGLQQHSFENLKSCKQKYVNCELIF